MIKFIIDGIEVQGEANESVLDVATRYGIEIPTLCHSEKIKQFGACGLCVVEAENSPKLLRACATSIAEGMNINTATARVLRARKTALELLMSDHDGDCLAPCQLECPAQTDCQAYVGLIANGRYEESLRVLKNRLPLPASIGRVCPHPCETACRRTHFENPVSIAQLKSFVADIDLNGDSYMPEVLADSGKSVAIIGGGPAGLSAAYFLRQKGHAVTIYDMMPYMGGMLRYGIPQYRLPKEVLQMEIDLIEKMGVKLKNNVKLPGDITLAQLQKEHNAVLVAVGAWVSAPMRVSGEDTANVFGGIDFLRSVVEQKPFDIGKNVAVCGGGNTAMDACRTAIRLGAENVYIIYRRTKNEMPADLVEIEEAEEEGVTFKYLTNPSEIISKDGRVSAIKLQKMALGEPDASGRRSPVPTDEYETLDVDSVIMAIGQKSELAGFEALEITKGNTISADEQRFTTNTPGVFAAGDVTNNGAGIAVAAIGEAQKASNAICAYLEGVEIEYKPPILSKRVVNSRDDLPPVPEMPRIKMAHLSPNERRSNFKEIMQGYTEEQARFEAWRCLECGCMDYFECKLVNYANKYNIDMERLAGRGHNRRVPDTHPYIIRNEDKCILCGQCVRICNEVVGKTALGFVGRGFDTIVKPAMAEPLENTDCIGCGQCVSLCPTGALTERQTLTKSVPLDESRTRTTCGLCAAGCQMDAMTHGQLVLRTVPTSKTESFGNGLLCKRGRFEFADMYKFERLTRPLVGGKESDFDTAFAAAKQKLYGGNTAVIIGADMICETVDKALELASALEATAYYVDSREPNAPFWMDGRELGGANVKYLQDKGVKPFVGADVRAAFVIGAKLPETLKAEFICAGGLYSDCVEADIVFPSAAFLEENGTLINFEGVRGAVQAAIKPVSGYTNVQIIEKLI